MSRSGSGCLSTQGTPKYVLLSQPTAQDHPVCKKIKATTTCSADDTSDTGVATTIAFSGASNCTPETGASMDRARARITGDTARRPDISRIPRELTAGLHPVMFLRRGGPSTTTKPTSGFRRTTALSLASFVTISWVRIRLSGTRAESRTHWTHCTRGLGGVIGQSALLFCGSVFQT